LECFGGGGLEGWAADRGGGGGGGGYTCLFLFLCQQEGTTCLLTRVPHPLLLIES